MTDKAKLRNTLKRLVCALRSAARLSYDAHEADIEIHCLRACAEIAKAKQLFKEDVK